MTWRHRGPFVALCRLDNSASACAATKSILWDVGCKPTTATSTATSAQGTRNVCPKYAPTGRNLICMPIFRASMAIDFVRYIAYYFLLTEVYMRTNTTNAILRKIRAKRPGWVFTPKQFAQLGTRAAVDQALSRLSRSGAIRRLARGIYEFPKSHPQIGVLSPSPEAIAQAMAERTGSRIMVSGAKAANLLGLSTQVPMQNLFLTEGPSRTIRIGNQTVLLKHVAPSKMLGAGTEAGIVIQAVRSLGKKGVNEIPIHELAKRLPRPVKTAVKRLASAAPTWSQPVLNQISA